MDTCNYIELYEKRNEKREKNIWKTNILQKKEVKENERTELFR